MKCPYSLRDKSLRDEIESGNFYIRIEDGQYKLRKNHQYFYQTQLEMFVTGTKYCDFFVWTPAEFLCIRILPDEMFEGVIQHCDKYWESVILKELLLRTLENATVILSDAVNVCKKCLKDDNDMIKCKGCGNCYHPKCVGRKTLAKPNTWTCKDCK